MNMYFNDSLTVSDQGFTKHYFIEGQRIASRLGEAFVGDLAALVKADPLEALYRSLPELPDFAVDRLVRDFDCLGADYRNFYPGETFLDGLERALTAEAYTENDIYFYHSDHLGSSSFLTDINGDATQHLQYLPFGEDWVHQQNTAAYYTPYTFSGKERDMETGLSYFGARFYDASLSIWLSVDPMADKYPSLSAYNYCAWNPVMLVDPDGRELDVAENQSSTNDLLSIVNPANRDRVKIENGKVSVNTEGLSKNALKKDKGLSLINDLVNSDKKFLFESVEIADFNDENCLQKRVAISISDENGVLNASNYGADGNNEHKIRPADGYDGHVMISSSGLYFSSTTKREVSRSSVIFHELAENYFRTHFGYDYHGNATNKRFGAHYRAVDLEGNHYGNPSPGNVFYQRGSINEQQFREENGRSRR